jgi:hypothetical protein
MSEKGKGCPNEGEMPAISTRSFKPPPLPKKRRPVEITHRDIFLTILCIIFFGSTVFLGFYTELLSSENKLLTENKDLARKETVLTVQACATRIRLCDAYVATLAQLLSGLGVVRSDIRRTPAAMVLEAWEQETTVPNLPDVPKVYLPNKLPFKTYAIGGGK